MPPIGGRKTLRVGAGDQLGIHAAGLLEQAAAQVRFASPRTARRRRAATRPDRSAILVTETSPASWTISPSTSSRPAAIAPWISCRVSRALVIAIVGRMSIALGDQVGEVVGDAVAPGIERDDLAGLAPLLVRADLADRRGVVQVRAGPAGPSRPRRWPARGRSNRSRHARRSRCGRAPALTVAITGPRSAAVGAPQRSGKRAGPREPGCEVSRIWPLFPSGEVIRNSDRNRVID